MSTVKVGDVQSFEPRDRWTTVDASELYDVERWGKGYFSVGDNGDLLVHPTKDASRNINLKKLMDQLVLRGIHPPLRANDGNREKQTSAAVMARAMARATPPPRLSHMSNTRFHPPPRVD